MNRMFLPNYGRRKLTNSVFKAIYDQVNVMRISGSSAAKPSVPFIDKSDTIFSMAALKHHWGAWPVVITLALGLAGEVFGMLYLGATRSDVWFTKDSAHCDMIETRKGYPAKIKKIKVINQKREFPPGLLAAVRGDVDGPPVEEAAKDPKKK